MQQPEEQPRNFLCLFSIKPNPECLLLARRGTGCGRPWYWLHDMSPSCLWASRFLHLRLRRPLAPNDRPRSVYFLGCWAKWPFASYEMCRPGFMLRSIDQSGMYFWKFRKLSMRLDFANTTPVFWIRSWIGCRSGGKMGIYDWKRAGIQGMSVQWTLPKSAWWWVNW